MLFSALKKINFRGTLKIEDSSNNVFTFGSSNPIVKIKLTNKSIERRLFFNPSLYLGEGYMNEEIVMKEGSIDDFLNIITASYDDFVKHNRFFKYYEFISSLFKPFHQINRLINSKKKCCSSL